MTVPRVEASPWAASRTRALTLRDQHGFAAEVLTLYLALLEVWEETWRSARAAGIDGPGALAAWTAEHVVPRVVAATVEAGPRPLAAALSGLSRTETTAVAEVLAAWLAGDELAPVEEYLARTSLWGPLAAADADTMCVRDPAPRGGRRCPVCGGRPQLSFRDASGDRLASGRRSLRCARCGHDWHYSATACASCGEEEGAKRTVYAEHRDEPLVGRGSPGEDDTATLPHLRVETCDTCQRYLVDVDLGRDPRAVPEVDELAALPLDLHAVERGHTKITPNVMGF